MRAVLTMGKVRRLLKMVWLDIETTGSNEEDGWILEVGMAVTEPVAPFAILGTIDVVIKPDDPQWSLSMNTVVTEMHETNGLRAEVEERGIDTALAEERLVTFLHGFNKKFRLAGSGVGHFDRRWLKALMPTLERMFDYAPMDVGDVRRLLLDYAQRPDLVPAVKSFGDTKKHRGLDDALAHLIEFRHYVELFSAGPLQAVDKEAEMA